MFKNVTIYKAPIYRVFADDVVLKNGIIIPEVKSEIASDEELFYSLYRCFVSIKYDCILADQDEATDFLQYAIDKNRNKIGDLINEGNKNDKEFKKYLRAITSCLYFNESEIKRDHLMAKDEFKRLRKSYKDEKKKK